MNIDLDQKFQIALQFGWGDPDLMDFQVVNLADGGVLAGGVTTSIQEAQKVFLIWSERMRSDVLRAKQRGETA